MTELYKSTLLAEDVPSKYSLLLPNGFAFDKSGKNFLYQDRKGFEDEWRKHHTSSITRDIWLYNTQSGKTYQSNEPGRGRPQSGVCARRQFCLFS